MSSAINGFGDYYSQYQNVDATTENLKNTLTGTNSSLSTDELMDACKEFESYFVEQVIKSMESFKKVPGAEEEESSEATSYYENFKDTLYQEYAATMTESGDFGIAQALYEQMKRNYGITE